MVDGTAGGPTTTRASLYGYVNVIELSDDDDDDRPTDRPFPRCVDEGASLNEGSGGGATSQKTVVHLQ